MTCKLFVDPGAEINQPQDFRLQINYFFVGDSVEPFTLPHTVQR